MIPSSGLVFYDDDDHIRLLPLTYLRPLAELRIGIWTIREKWCHYLGEQHYSYQTSQYLSQLYPVIASRFQYVIKGNLLPDPALVSAIQELSPEEVLIQNGTLLAAYSSQISDSLDGSNYREIQYENTVRIIKHPEQIFMWNESELKKDFIEITKDRKSANVDDSNSIKNEDQIFIEESAVVENSILNAGDGPIYIGENAKILDGSMIKGATAFCRNTLSKMGSKIYGATTIGPGSKVGGEVKNAVLFGNSNKTHDGYLGNAVIAEWCNLGADTNASNLKNDYSEVKLWDYTSQSFRKTGTQFCGLIMGDHSKCGINTMFNTGTVVGISCNIFGSGYQKNFIPSFSYGGPKRYETYKLEKAQELATLVWKRQNKEFTSEDAAAFNLVHGESAKYRR